MKKSGRLKLIRAIGIFLFLVVGYLAIIVIEGWLIEKNKGYYGPSSYKPVGGKIDFVKNDSTGFDDTHKAYDTISGTEPIFLYLNFENDWFIYPEDLNDKHNYLYPKRSIFTNWVKAIPCPMPSEYFRKIIFVSKHKIRNSFTAHDTINNNIKYYNNNKILLPINTMMDTVIADKMVFIFTPSQPITEITPFQIEATVTLSDSTEFKIVSPKIYLNKSSLIYHNYDRPSTKNYFIY
jgi:hypothetical protein